MLYRQLFLAVFKCLSRPGLKRLTYQDLLNHLRIADLSASDSELLKRIETSVLSLNEQLLIVQQAVEKHERQINGLFVQQRNTETHVTRDLGPIDTTPPPSVDRSVKRSKIINELLSVFRNTTWLALHGGVGSGKSELVKLLLSALSPVKSIFLTLRDKSPAVAELYFFRGLRHQASVAIDASRTAIIESATQRLLPNGIIVVDDLPVLVPGDGLSRGLVELCRACRTRGVRILTTSHYSLAEGVADQLAQTNHASLAVPPFDESDVNELFSAWGMPEQSLDPSTIQFLHRRLAGHPMLLTATARYLSEQNWHVERPALENLFGQGHIADVIEDGLRRLIATVEDTSNRRFLYRLCLVQGSFSSERAFLVAQVDVPLDRPRERLVHLAGPWLQTQGDRRMLVCPLVRPLAATELDGIERSAVNLALGDEIARMQEKSVLDVAEAVGYFSAAEAYGRISALLILAFHASSQLPDSQVRFLLSTSWLDARLPEQMAVADRLYLRSFQIKSCERVGLSTTRLFAECDKLVASSPADGGWAVFAFAVHTLRIRAKADFRAAMRNLSEAAAVFPNLAELRGWPSDLKPASLLWHVVAEINSPPRLHSWLDALESFSLADVRNCFQGENVDYFGCQIATDSVWMAEHLKPAPERNWSLVADVLERAQRVAEQRSLEPLFAASVRSRIVVVADYLNDRVAAATVATEALKQVSDPLSTLLISESIGRQFFFKKDYSDAEGWLRKAVAVQDDRMPHIAADAKLYLSAALAEAGDKRSALQLRAKASASSASMAIRSLRSNESLLLAN